MELLARLVHAEAGRRVVRVLARVDGRSLGSALGEAASAEEAEDRALQRLLERLGSALGGELGRERREQPPIQRTAAGSETAPRAPSAPAPVPAPATATATATATAPAPAVTAPAPAQAPVPAPAAAGAGAPTQGLPPAGAPARDAVAPAPEGAALDPEDWSGELLQIERQLQRLGWQRDQETVYLQRAFGHPSRSRLTSYGDLLAYLRALESLAAGSDPGSAAVPLRRQDLLSQCDDLLHRLGWQADQGRRFLEEQLGAASRSQLDDQQLLQFNMLLEGELMTAQR